MKLLLEHMGGLLALFCLAAMPAGTAEIPLHNPIWVSEDNLRDPSVLKVAGGYHLFYSRFVGTNWALPSSWTIARTFTKDFAEFARPENVSPSGFASPGDVILWHGRYLLPYQSYPTKPTLLCFSESTNLQKWSAPKFFLAEAADLPWNTYHRVIDPSFVLEGDTLHCFFVGSCDTTNTAGKKLRANLLGHAITCDPDLKRWEILTRDSPLIGISQRAPDGVENIMVFRTGDLWTMIYSEGLENQHLALATSGDLRNWKLAGSIEIPRQKWMSRKYGAPFVWRDGAGWRMILMGQNDQNHTTLGLLDSSDGRHWTLLPE
jgi:sucrose-6-phosphate hydrolase SacC (GH32 family)